jgi:beta-galactosidase
MNRPRLRKLVLTGCLVAMSMALAGAQDLTVSIAGPPPSPTAGFNMGASRRPDGATLTLDSSSLILNEQRWMPAMGEFQYSRYPETEWREELLKMKAGGIDIVSTYVFWIHHEEVEGQFDWSGRRNLRGFVQLCGDLGLKMIIRCGPWDHGEVRNGGFPDWLLKKGWDTRCDNTNYLEQVKIFYGQIARQLSGLLWKDGGPVIGIQLENEYSGPAQHLLTLKGLARAAGLDVPLYTRTGWPGLGTPMPFGEIVPLYGVYAEGFWDRELTSMPGPIYWKGFQFSSLRTEGVFGTDIPGEVTGSDGSDVRSYPYLSCEIGAGMMSSYHRRIVVNPLDSESTTFVKLGSGGASTGYYMYHGGENPDGKLSTLMESQATGMWNDMPVKNYDFQTALGQYGQIRPQYHLLRRLHLFLHEWGPSLAAMSATMPDQRPHGHDDVDTLRWSVRSDGRSGFVFVNNYQRSTEMPPKKNARFTIKLPSGSLTFPSTPVTVPADDCFIWPFNLDLGHGISLAWATAQPITTVDEGKLTTVFFAATPDVPPQFAFDKNGATVRPMSGHLTGDQGRIIVQNVATGTGVALKVTANDGQIVQVVVLDGPTSLALWKQPWFGRDRAFLTHAGLVVDGDNVRLTSANLNDLNVGVYPPPASVEADGVALDDKVDGIFQCFAPPTPAEVAPKVTFENVQLAGQPRDIPIGKIDRPVATAPLDPDFAKAAVWRIHLPANLDLGLDPIVRFHYTGDVARVTLNGKLLTDDFYNGNALDLGLRRYAPEILNGDLRIAILPLRKDAPVFMADQARPDFGKSGSVATLRDIEIIPRYQVQISGRRTDDSAKAK